MNDLHEGRVHPDRTYYLYDASGTLQTHRGLYAIVDAGYFEWRCLMAPLKHAHGDDAALWSECVESVRKAVERT